MMNARSCGPKGDYPLLSSFPSTVISLDNQSSSDPTPVSEANALWFSKDWIRIGQVLSLENHILGE